MDKQKAEIENQILLEQNDYFQLTTSHIKCFLKNLKKGNINDSRYRQLIINTLVNRVYLYDEKLTIIFNSQERTFTTKMPSIEMIEGSFLGKDFLPCFEDSLIFLESFFVKILKKKVILWIK